MAIDIVVFVTKKYRLTTLVCYGKKMKMNLQFIILNARDRYRRIHARIAVNIDCFAVNALNMGYERGYIE